MWIAVLYSEVKARGSAPRFLQQVMNPEDTRIAAGAAKVLRAATRSAAAQGRRYEQGIERQD